MTRRAWFNALSHASACLAGIRSVRFARFLSFPFSCSRSAATVCVAVLKKTAQFRFDINFPLGANFLLYSVCRRTEDAFLGSRRPIGIGARGNLSKQFGKKGIEFGDISIWFLRRQISISTDLLERGEQQITMQLLHVKFGALAHAAPQNGTPFLMNFQHVSLRFLARITENALKNHGHVTH